MHRQVARARYVLERYGTLGTARQTVRYARNRRSRQATAQADHEFDATAGVDTSGIIALWELDVDSPHLALCHRYEAVPAVVFHQLMTGVPAGQAATFVDLGAGKGRALLLAREYPFTRIVGVEFSPELADVARANLQGEARCEVVCCDAVDYEIPDGPLVVFANNPFDGDLMQRVLDNLRIAHTRQPRPVDLLVLNPGLCLPRDMGAFQALSENHYRMV